MSCASLVDAPPRRALWSFSAGRLSSPLRVCLLRSFVYTTGVLAPDKPALCVCALFRSLSHAHALAQPRGNAPRRRRGREQREERRRENERKMMCAYAHHSSSEERRSDRRDRIEGDVSARVKSTDPPRPSFATPGRVRPAGTDRPEETQVNANFHRAFSST